ncbi:hypothetical protein [Shewanella xiamenensis]|uniref:hypothetical protein n=1 Tax=Shewanella xiamenensis TaxID=332186 RepID=UPI001C501208|nr:hypothetical protein [Shewanella xiamenensis]MBW0279048.1 hypothetical protein [Shewanella xiamenensis]MCT8871082.1 hypothetical protein [Shewanella xiamenensis]UWH41723.1 hypothetical protein KXJ80_21265 [Shewanella xiamenensis]
MALFYRFKILDFQLDGKKYEFCESDTVVAYVPHKKKLNISIAYLTGILKPGFFFSSKEKLVIGLSLDHHQYTIELLVKGDEQTTQIKNMGGGALVGAVVAGPFGAAAGAYFASKIKECPCIIKITEPNLIIKCLAPTGFIKENHKIEFLKD